MKRRGRSIHVDGDGFRVARLIAGFDRKVAAALLGVTVRTVCNWEAKRCRVPYSAFKLMRILSGYALPGEAWEGWSVRGDTLWSPEQRPFRPADVAWWGLTVAMARQFAIEHGAARLSPADLSGEIGTALHARVAPATAAGHPQSAAGVAGVTGSPAAPVGGGSLPEQLQVIAYPSPRAVIRGESREVLVSLGRG